MDLETITHPEPSSLDETDFFSEENLADPYELLARLRDEQPVYKFHQKSFNRDQYIVTPYALVEKVFRDHENYSSGFMEILTGGAEAPAEVQEILAKGWPEVNTMFTADEPDHTRLRALAQKAFFPKRIKRMSELIEQTVHKLIDEFIERGECDFVRDFAVPLPVNSIGEIMGVSYEDRALLNAWTIALMRRNGQMGTMEQQIADARKIHEAKEYVHTLIEERRTNPRDDLINDLITSEIEGEKAFDDLEVLSTVFLLLIAGAETARSTLISTIVRLLDNPDVLDRVIADPSLAPKVMEEVLRLDTPGTALWRVTNRETELGGTTIPDKSIVMMRIDSANRDDTVFERPDEFDIDRPNISRHLSFGSGIHYCIGFRLAREQVNISIPILLDRLRDLKLVREKSDLRSHPSVHTKCLREVHLSFLPGQKLLS